MTCLTFVLSLFLCRLCSSNNDPKIQVVLNELANDPKCCLCGSRGFLPTKTTPKSKKTPATDAMAQGETFVGPGYPKHVMEARLRKSLNAIDNVTVNPTEFRDKIKVLPTESKTLAEAFPAWMRIKTQCQKHLRARKRRTAEEKTTGRERAKVLLPRQ